MLACAPSIATVPVVDLSAIHRRYHSKFIAVCDATGAVCGNGEEVGGGAQSQRLSCKTEMTELPNGEGECVSGKKKASVEQELSFSEQEIEALGLENPDVHLEPGEVLFTPYYQDRGRLYILKKGRIRLYKTNPEGRELSIDLVVAGRMFGEMVLTTQKKQEMFAQAMEPSVLSPLSIVELEYLILERPELGLRIVRSLSERLRYYQTRIEDLCLKDAPSRLASFILHLVESEGVISRRGYKIPTRYTHEYLGTVINANRETVTKAFARLQDEGSVELHRRYIYVTDVEALERIAERNAIDLAP